VKLAGKRESECPGELLAIGGFIERDKTSLGAMAQGGYELGPRREIEVSEDSAFSRKSKKVKRVL